MGLIFAQEDGTMKQTNPELEKQMERVWRLLIESGMLIEDILAIADIERDMPTVETWDEIAKLLTECRIMVAKESRWKKEGMR